jgi:hypothetical protein
MAEPRTPLPAMSEDALAAALRDLATALDLPTSAAPGAEDLAVRVRQRIVETGIEPRQRGWQSLPGRGWRLRRSLVLAVAALLVLAAVAAAVGLGLPGLRFVFGEAPAVPSAVPAATPTGGAIGAPGSTLGLGAAVSFAEAERLAELDLRLPPDPSIGPPEATYLGPGGRVSLVWAARPGLPDPGSDGIGLLLSEFRGSVDAGYYEKAIESRAQVTPVSVDGRPGYWISGVPHFFVFVDADGEFVEDTHRMVGDTLVWTDGDVTYRLESGLGVDEAIALAETLE